MSKVSVIAKIPLKPGSRDELVGFHILTPIAGKGL